MARSDALDCDQMRELASEIRLPEILTPGFRRDRSHEEPVGRKVNPLRRGSNRVRARSVGDHGRVDSQRLKTVSQEQTSWRSVRFGCRWLRVRNEKARHDGNSACMNGEIHRGRCELSCSETRRSGSAGLIEFAGTQAAPRGIAVNESLKGVE